jgi:hypothetical protein
VRDLQTTIGFVLGVAIALLAMLFTAASGQDQFSASVVRVRTLDHDGLNSLGTGVYLSGNWCLTAWHVVADARNGQTYVNYDSGRKTARVKHRIRNKYEDQCLLELYEPLPLPGVKLRRGDPQPGETAYLCGVTGGSQYGTTPCRVMSVGEYRTADTGTPVMRLSASSVSGDSGGPVFDSNGYLIGNLWGSDGPTTSAVANSTTRAFFARVKQEWESVPLTGYGTPIANCPTGTCPTPQPTPQPDQTCPPGSCQVTIDIDALVNKMAESGKFRGPAGQDGKDGRNGEDGRNGTDGKPGAAGPSGPPGTVDVDLVRTMIQEELANLPPAYLQPSYYDAAGNLRPEGSPLEIRLGQETPLPPVGLSVEGVSGRKSHSHAPNGGWMHVKMADLE